MSSKALSPAAQLLRHSRLMAMPAPIAPPPASGAQAPPPSPYPLTQAITTPRSSAFRGDWGLKRDLPLKTSQKTTYMRYNDLDTIEHMTTFESAHDHVYTLKKWQEMDMVIEGNNEDLVSDGLSRSRGSFETSPTVFDSATKPESYKWRFEGPHITSMPNVELREYVVDKILPRKEEFRAFVAARQNQERAESELRATNETVTSERIMELAAKYPLPEVDLLALRANRACLQSGRQ